MNGIVHDFQEQLAYSSRLSDEGDWLAFYRRIWPDALLISRIDANCQWQRWGIDRIVTLPNGRQILIDEKKRQKDYGDIALEEWSVWYGEGNPRNKIGWTLDPEKRCDYVVYAVPCGRKAWLLPAELLRMAFKAEYEKWTAPPRKPCFVQNKGYQTVNWYIAWDEIAAGLLRQMYRRLAHERVELPDAREIGSQMLLFSHKPEERDDTLF